MLVTSRSCTDPNAHRRSGARAGEVGSLETAHPNGTCGSTVLYSAFRVEEKALGADGLNPQNPDRDDGSEHG
jgi:hypothetical protein